VAAGCGKARTNDAPERPVVEVANVVQRDQPVYSEWTASTDGLVNATIRAQVSGYLIKRNYKEGDYVQKGQILFEIDPRPFQAALEQAKGQLEQQKARYVTAKANLERIKPLVEQRAVSMRELDDAVGNEQAGRAAVLSAQAVVDKAALDLGFTRITSPISGIAGIARAQLGNLVGPGSIEELTTVSTVDPIKVYVPLSEQEYLKNIQNGGRKGGRVPLDLILADGRLHPYKGAFAFADRQIDVKTGTIRVAGLFPNPGNVLRPGQFARVRAQTSIRKGALLVPQRAVSEFQGGHQVFVVSAENKVAIRPVRVGERVDSLWVIDTGLNPGERVVAEGLQKVRDGMAVTVRPFVPPTGAPEGRSQGLPPAEPRTTSPPDKAAKG
jgi:membrane fusion protein (multidrug efflux system)